jgi:hypothetical protein
MRLVARVAGDAGDTLSAVRCAAFADANANALITMPPDDRAAHALRVEQWRAGLAPEDWATAWAAGAAMDAAGADALIASLVARQL